MVRLRFKQGISNVMLAGNGNALTASVAADGLSATVVNVESGDVVGEVGGSRKAYTLKALRNFLLGYGVVFQDETRARVQQPIDPHLDQTDALV